MTGRCISWVSKCYSLHKLIFVVYFCWLLQPSVGICEVKTTAIDAELMTKANLKQCVRQWERLIDLAIERDIYLLWLFDI